MVPISHTYTSIYATPDNETHFRTVRVQFDPVENFAVPAQPVCIGGSQVSSKAFFLAFPPSGANQISNMESGTRRLSVNSAQSCGVGSSLTPPMVPPLTWGRGTHCSWRTSHRPRATSRST